MLSTGENNGGQQAVGALELRCGENRNQRPAEQRRDGREGQRSYGGDNSGVRKQVGEFMMTASDVESTRLARWLRPSRYTHAHSGQLRAGRISRPG